MLRAQATYSHSNGTNTVVLTKTFTVTATDGAGPAIPAKGAIFNAATIAAGGTMGYETAIPSPPSLVYANGTGDSVAVGWTISL